MISCVCVLPSWVWVREVVMLVDMTADDGIGHAETAPAIISDRATK